MNNEIGRKTTSLILMTIMVAGGLTFAIPSMEPVYAQSTPNLYVSAADPNGYGARFDNTFGGLQIVQVIVNDPLIRDADDAEPRVTVDDTTLKMNRHTDGNWYGYFRAVDDPDGNTPSFADAQNLWHSTDGGQPKVKNIVRQAGITIGENTGNATDIVKSFELDDTFNIVYHKAGSPQTISITYDDSVNNDLTLDRTSYPRNSHVHVKITDHILNIDPTTKDVWRYAVDGGVPTYMYDNNSSKIRESEKQPIMPTSTNLGCKDDKCSFSIDDIGSSDTNDLLQLESGTTNYIFEETGPNTGVFTITNDDKSPIMVQDNAPRGQNTQIMYSDETVSVNVRLTTATVDLDIKDGTWNSGEKIDLTVVDADQNLNSDAEDDQTITNPDARIPIFMTGDPHTLMDGKTDMIYVYGQVDGTGKSDNSLVYTTTGPNAHALNYTVDDSHRGIVWWSGTDSNIDNEVLQVDGTGAGPRLAIPLGTLGDLQESIHGDDSNKGDFIGRNLLNYDWSSINGTAGDGYLLMVDKDGRFIRDGWYTSASSWHPHHPADNALLDITSYTMGTVAGRSSGDNIQLSSPKLLEQDNIDRDTRIFYLAEFSSTLYFEEGKKYPIIVDFFSYGFYGDGSQAADRVANQIIRIEVEETGENTSTFTGTLEYIMVNQLNVIVDNKTGLRGSIIDRTDFIYDSITPIGNEVKFIAFEDITGSDARVNYADMDSNGNMAVVSDQQDIATSSGVVSLNAETYSVGSNVVITLEDSDLNTDPDRADTYTVVTRNATDGTEVGMDRDQVGEDVVSTYEDKLPGGKSLGMLLEVTFDGKRWQSGCTLSDGVQNGLGATGFTLQETGSSTGVFTGSFSVPKEVCNFNDDGSVNTNESKITVSGKDIGVTYLDFRDASGQIVTAGDSASIGASTGSVSLDRTVYPVPYGQGTTTGSRALDMAGANLAGGTVKVYIQVNDPDYNLNPTGEDKIEDEDGNGPVKVTISRSGDECAIGHAGGKDSNASDAISKLKQIRDDALQAYTDATDAEKTTKQTAYLLAGTRLGLKDLPKGTTFLDNLG